MNKVKVQVKNAFAYSKQEQMRVTIVFWGGLFILRIKDHWTLFFSPFRELCSKLQKLQRK